MQQSAFGVVCLTPDNLSSPWLHYEAGVLRATESLKLCPLLHGVDKASVQPPLGQLQLTTLQERDMALLMRSMNRSTSAPLPQELLDASFRRWWPDLEERLAALPPPAPREANRPVIEAVLRSSCELLRVREPGVEFRAFVTLADEHKGVRRTWCGDNIDVEPDVSVRTEVPLDFGIAGQAFQTGTMRAGDLTDESRNLGTDGLPVDGIWEAVRSVVAFPLFALDGRTIGTLNVDCDATLEQAGLHTRRVQQTLAQVATVVGQLLTGPVLPPVRAAQQPT